MQLPYTIMPKPKQIGVVSNYFANIKVAAIKLSAPLKVGDRIHITGGEETDFKQKIRGIQLEHEKKDKAKKGDEIGTKVNKKVRKGYKVFKA